MNDQPTCKHVLALALVLCVAVIASGCQTGHSDAQSMETEKEIAHPPSDTTKCRDASLERLQPATRIFIDRAGEPIIATEHDTVGVRLNKIFSPPGYWSFASRSSHSGSASKTRRQLRYHCESTMHQYLNCGKPESIGNPDEYSGSEDVFLHFDYSIDRCSLKINISFDHQNPQNSRYAAEYAKHHSFPPKDTLSYLITNIDL